MIRYAVLIPILGLALVAGACGDGDSGLAPSPSPTGEAVSSTAAIGETPPTEVTPSVDEETPDIEETPGTISSPTPAGTPAVGPGEPGFDISTEIKDCVLDADTSVADCGDQGTFTIDPPLVGDYTACDVYVIQRQPVMLICTGGEQVQPVYYVIPR